MHACVEVVAIHADAVPRGVLRSLSPWHARQSVCARSAPGKLIHNRIANPARAIGPNPTPDTTAFDRSTFITQHFPAGPSPAPAAQLKLSDVEGRGHVSTWWSAGTGSAEAKSVTDAKSAMEQINRGLSRYFEGVSGVAFSTSRIRWRRRGSRLNWQRHRCHQGLVSPHGPQGMSPHCFKQHSPSCPERFAATVRITGRERAKTSRSSARSWRCCICQPRYFSFALECTSFLIASSRMPCFSGGRLSSPSPTSARCFHWRLTPVPISRVFKAITGINVLHRAGVLHPPV